MLCLCHCRVLEQFIVQVWEGLNFITTAAAFHILVIWEGSWKYKLFSYLSLSIRMFLVWELPQIFFSKFPSEISSLMFWCDFFCIIWITLVTFTCRWVCTCANRSIIMLKVSGVKMCPFSNSPGKPSGITESGFLRTESWAPGHPSPFGMLASKARSSTEACHQLIRKRWAGK